MTRRTFLLAAVVGGFVGAFVAFVLMGDPAGSQTESLTVVTTDSPPQ